MGLKTIFLLLEEMNENLLAYIMLVVEKSLPVKCSLEESSQVKSSLQNCQMQKKALRSSEGCGEMLTYESKSQISHEQNVECNLLISKYQQPGVLVFYFKYFSY